MASSLTIILWSSLGMAGALAGLLWLRGRSARWLSRAVPLLVSVAAGVILATAFLTILPEAFEEATQSVSTVLIAMFVGFLFFYTFERLFFWAHCHDGYCDVHAPGYLVLIGDTIHNFTDGVLIAATFLVDPAVGVLTAVAVAMHEIPQEFGEFAIFVQSGLSRGRALFYNIISAAAAPIGAGTALLILSVIEPFLGLIIAAAAGAFLYIAAADLIPHIHHHHGIDVTHDTEGGLRRRGRRPNDWLHTALLFLGIVIVIAVVVAFPEQHIEENAGHTAVNATQQIVVSSLL